MTNTLLRKPKEYLLLTFAITWGCWGTIILANQFGFLGYGTAGSMMLFLIGGNGPPIASYILMKKWGEIDGARTFFKLYFNFKSSAKNYGLIVLLLLIHFLIPIALASTHRTLPIYYGFLMFPANLIGGGLEEIGWRGILQPALEKISTFAKATMAVSAIWAVWHLPLWFIAGTFQSEISFMYFGVAVVGMAFSLAAIKRVTAQTSLCILYHTAMNSFWGIFMLSQNHSTFIIVIVEVILAISIVSFAARHHSKQLLVHQRQGI